MLTLAHQILWPEPAKNRGKRRAPYARVGMMRLRCTKLMRREWLKLLQLPPEQPPAPTKAPDHEGDPDDRLAYCLEKARQTGNVGNT